jgi:hypothetical protein
LNRSGANSVYLTVCWHIAKAKAAGVYKGRPASIDAPTAATNSCFPMLTLLSVVLIRLIL